MAYFELAVPVPLRQTFTYFSTDQLVPGLRVLVPFGNREMTGVVMKSTDTPASPEKIKAIKHVYDEQPVLDGTLLSLCHWLSQYYHHPIGEVAHTMLPVLLRKGESAQAQPMRFFKVADNVDAEALVAVKRAKKQHALLLTLQESPLEMSLLQEQYSAAVIRAVTEKGLVETFEKPATVEDKAWLNRLKVAEKPLPDPEQAVAITAINQQAGKFAPFLLEGVTGSGKTEVYLQAIEPVLQGGRQVLILVPEIGLTPQTVNRFRQRFGIEVGVLHSQLNDGARLRVWQQARNGELGIVIGTRSAIFTPLKYPGMLIVDEEHDESFKQQDGLRYHARDLAVMRAQESSMPLVMGTATPSLETLHNALTKRYGHLQLTRRAGGAQITRQHILDIKDQPVRFGIAAGMLKIIRQHLEQGNQVLVFVNRRGFAPAILCHHCGEVEQCQRCERPFTVHRGLRRLQCHHCGATRPIPSTCSRCHSKELVTEGVGTEQLEQGLTQLFPGSPQVRIDSDSVRGKDKLQQILRDINQQKYQLLIGTQILSKGHHFPHVTLVVVLDCDGALFSADFRAAEKLAQLVTQLAGRAGRATKPGEMWLQSHNPAHPLLQDLVQNGYHHFARHALLERKMALLPPFQSQILLRAEAIQGEQAYHFLQQARQYLEDDDLQLIGPMPSLMEKRQGRYRFILVAQASNRKPLHNRVRLALPAIAAQPLASRVRWALDVDPTDFT